MDSTGCTERVSDAVEHDAVETAPEADLDVLIPVAPQHRLNRFGGGARDAIEGCGKAVIPWKSLGAVLVDARSAVAANALVPFAVLRAWLGARLNPAPEAGIHGTTIVTCANETLARINRRFQARYACTSLEAKRDAGVPERQCAKGAHVGVFAGTEVDCLGSITSRVEGRTANQARRLKAPHEAEEQSTEDANARCDSHPVLVACSLSCVER